MKDLFDKLITKLQELNIFNLVSRYKGEFEDGAEWNPVFPACYVRLIGVKPELIGSEGEVLKHRISFVLYAADKDTNEPSVLELIDSVLSIDNIDNNPVFLQNVSWAGYAKGTEVYQIELDVVF